MEKTAERGRPPKNPQDRHSAVIYLKLTPADRATLEAAAEAKGKPLTVWVREVTLRAARRLAKR